MKKFFLDIYHVWFNELKVIFKDEAILILFFLVPFAYPLLYGFIYNNEVPRNVKMIVVDDSHSSIAREFSRKMNATPDVDIIGYTANLEDAQEAMRRKEIFGILYVPSDFSRNLHTRQQTQVMIYSDMSNMLFYKAMLTAATAVSLDMGADIRINDTGYNSRAVDEATMEPVSNEWVALYNPQNGFASFLVPAILILIIQQTMLLGIGTIEGTLNDKRRMKTWIYPSELRTVNGYIATLAKAFCYVSLYMLVCVWVFRVVPYLFRFPQIGDPVTIAVFLLPYLFASAFFAMALSSISTQREYGMLLFIFTSLAFVMLSGISWPWPSVPTPLKAIAYLIPGTPGIHGFVKINTMGASMQHVWFEYTILWIQAGIYAIIASLFYNYQKRKYFQEVKVK